MSPVNLRRRRGISYIMSVAIMTFVTLAMASVVLVWSLGITSTSQNTFSSAISANEAKTQERFSIEHVQFFSNSLSSSVTSDSAVGSTTLTDTSQTWTPHQYIGYAVYIYSGSGTGQTATICDNDATHLTIITAGACGTSTTGWTSALTASGSVSHYLISSAPIGGYLCASPNGCLLLYIRNVGAIQSVYDAVYLNNILATQSSYAVGGTGAIIPSGGANQKLSLGIQQLGSVAVPAPFLITSGTTYTISVSTTRGNLVTVVQTY